MPCREQGKEYEFFTTPRLNAVGTGDDHACISLEEDGPRISTLVQTQHVEGQDWRPLVAYLSSSRPNHHRHDCPYRQIWLHLLGYLVRPSHAALFFEKLRGRNFHGRWMPEGLQLGSGRDFVSEYPWAPSFKLPDEEVFRSRGSSTQSLRLRRLLSSDALHNALRCPSSVFAGIPDLLSADALRGFLLPAWNDLFSEWQYDASLDGAGVSVRVPARLLLGDELWLDGRGSFHESDDRIVFLDPSVGMNGPSALMVDVGHLGAKLQKVDRCLIWTLLGEKRMFGGSIRQQLEHRPMRTFSQIAWMDAKGTIRESDLMFFDDPNHLKGLA